MQYYKSKEQRNMKFNSTTDTTKSCIRIYSFSKLYGHTTYEVFMQQDENGRFQYFTDRGGIDGSSYIELSLEQPAKKVRELIRIAKARAEQKDKKVSLGVDKTTTDMQ
jgi:hypothetical protein